MGFNSEFKGLKVKPRRQRYKAAVPGVSTDRQTDGMRNCFDYQQWCQIFLFSKHPDLLKGPPHSYSVGTRSFFSANGKGGLRVKLTAHMFSAEMNERNYTSISCSWRAQVRKETSFLTFQETEV